MVVGSNPAGPTTNYFLFEVLDLKEMIGALLGGAVVTETIFAWPGIGRLVIQAISNRDFPVVQGVVLFFALIRLTINLVTDVLYVWFDPRIGHV